MREISRLRCAIYTRKSSEEGLEQDFNSLHAQREACEAYIVSQKHEGWKLIPTLYDDGGFSGGSMERPALARLLADIRSRLIDIVVVYKVDRLTRSLTDFAKIVEVFDGESVSFVSVTQAFNTTSSMGRLTLNVLLSFAQFEREVTGERIRDKIAASKKKGMWMGGSVPLGYDAKDRSLVIVLEEAETVRLIFDRYLQLQSVHLLQQELAAKDLRTKSRPGRTELMIGDKPFSRGHLYRILGNPVYVGKIVHKKEIHAGLHEPIIDPETWSRTQALLLANHHQNAVRSGSASPSLLAGFLVDEFGNSLLASHATKGGKRYRYYISRPSKDAAPATANRNQTPWRIPAYEIEDAVVRILISKLRDADWLLATAGKDVETLDQRRQLIARAETLAEGLSSEEQGRRREVIRTLVSSIAVSEGKLDIKVWTAPLRKVEGTADNRSPDLARTATIIAPIAIKRRHGELRILIDSQEPPEPESDAALLTALGQAHRWWKDLVDGRYETLRDIARAYDTDERYAAWILRLAFISPKLTSQILAGKQPWEFTLHGFIKEASAGVS